MKILIASDSFKGCLTSKMIGELGQDGLLKGFPEAQVDYLPMADGGEGTVEAIIAGCGGNMMEIEVTGPFGQRILANYGILSDDVTAVMEMASASGISLQPRSQLNPLKATSYGTGEVILDAVKRGCRKIILGIGGSATNDGGMGMLQAMGFEFYDQAGELIEGNGEGMSKLYTIEAENLSKELMDTEFIIACDVKNPLTGPDGATYTYGAQKGANAKALEELEEGMRHFGVVLEKTCGIELMELPGTGASGGISIGLLGFFKTSLTPGFSMINEQTGLESRILREGYDLIITGEGQINHQTPHGKLPSGIAAIGQRHQIPVVAVVGSVERGYEALYDQGLTGVFSIVTGPMTLEIAIEEGEALVWNAYYNLGRLLRSTRM